MHSEEAVITSPSELGTLSISDLAARTSVPQATLRSWEARYGFPAPSRLPGGHRRYAEADVLAVEEVLRHRASGLALEAAVRKVVSADTTLETMSLYAELTRRHPDLKAQLLSKPALVALSHAIEDECCARALRPLLFGGFQQGRFLRESYAQWVELARTAQRAVVFAQFTDPVPPTAPRVPIEVSIPADAPLQREWLVVCDAPDYPAVMVGWERPGQAGLADSRRRFEVLWSVDARVVRDATRICLDLVDTYRPGWRTDGFQVPMEEAPAASSDLRRATDLLNRTMGYLDASMR